MELVERCVVKNYKMPNLDEAIIPNEYASYKGSAQNHYLLYKDIVNFINQDIPISMEASESVKLIERIEDIYKS